MVMSYDVVGEIVDAVNGQLDWHSKLMDVSWFLSEPNARQGDFPLQISPGNFFWPVRFL